MNHLAYLKKLTIKPELRERERVAIIIKGPKESTKTRKKRLVFKGEEEGVEVVEKELIENNPTEKKGALIVDETSIGFNRAELMKRLAESGKNKVISLKKIVEEPEPLIIERETEIANEFAEHPEIVEELATKPKKRGRPKRLVIEPTEEVELEIQPNIFLTENIPEEIEKEPLKIVKKRGKKKLIRITEAPEKGIAVLGPEIQVQFGDTEIVERLPPKQPPVIIKVSSYYMNNRETFVNFINSIFEPYKRELDENKESISCDIIGQTGSDFSLLTHQKIVRDYLNVYTPYRGLLLYHGLGSGKTCTSIAIAEGMKYTKQVIILTPASLRANYIEELKKCGDLLYKRNQFWEWISIKENPQALTPISAILNLPMEYIRKQNGAFFINIKKPSNYQSLNDMQKKQLEDQLNEMINQKYKFINYNGLRSQKLAELTNRYTQNIFDDSVVIIDEAHNLISRIVNKLKKEKPITGEENRKSRNQGKMGSGEEDPLIEKENIFGDQIPLKLATKLYYMLLRAKNARIVLLTGTPVINYPNEFAILFNILRGYIKTWKIPLNIATTTKVDKQFFQEELKENSLDYLDYSPSSKVLTITRNPFGFKNKLRADKWYQGVTNVKKSSKSQIIFEDDFISDEEFERNIISALNRISGVEVIRHLITVTNNKALPDNMDEFISRYINDEDKKLKNVDALKRRIIGLSSYFKSAQESLLPRYKKQIGEDYHIIRIPMSQPQFRVYETARKQEREHEKKKKAPSGVSELFQEKTSTYRIFSRLFCNYIIPDRPVPLKIQTKKDAEKDTGAKKKAKPDGQSDFELLLKEANRFEENQDVQDENLGEVEGDVILENVGGIDYKQRLDMAIRNIEEHPEDFLSKDALQTYSPKFLHMLENIQDEDRHQGLHLVYSQFRTAEGIGIFSLVLNNNGFARFKIKKTASGVWEIDIPEEDADKPKYALYTGTESSEEKEIIRHIYNGEWDQIPDTIGSVLKREHPDTKNNMGEVIKIFMITSSGSEGINLRNTRYVHIMEPYWHPVRSEQVIGRARRICSHKDLPEIYQTVEVFVYLMIFSKEQLDSSEAVELKLKDLSKSTPKVPITSDQYLYEISEIKANLTSQLTDAIKESAFDCYIYSNGKCFNFGDPAKDAFSYVPNYLDQQNDTTVRANKVAVKWKGKPVKYNGTEYISREMKKGLWHLYDKNSYLSALEDPTVIPLQIGILTQNEKGEFKFIF